MGYTFTRKLEINIYVASIGLYLCVPINLFNSPRVDWIFLPIMDSNPSAHVFKGGLMPLLHETLLLFFVTAHYNISWWHRKILHVIWTYFYECLFFTWGGPISHGVFITLPHAVVAVAPTFHYICCDVDFDLLLR